jgi:hypothetical protein
MEPVTTFVLLIQINDNYNLTGYNRLVLSRKGCFECVHSNSKDIIPPPLKNAKFEMHFKNHSRVNDYYLFITER